MALLFKMCEGWQVCHYHPTYMHFCWEGSQTNLVIILALEMTLKSRSVVSLLISLFTKAAG